MPPTATPPFSLTWLFLLLLLGLCYGYYTPPKPPSHQPRRQNITFGAILPRTALITVRRSYYKRIFESVDNLIKNKHNTFNFTNNYNITLAPVVMMSLSPSPNEILNALCTNLLSHGVITILYLTNSEVYGSNAASAQYLLQLTGYLGIPVIAWNADNLGLERAKRISDSHVLQMAPSVKHQSAAMLSILRRYDWFRFSIVTSQIGGHDDFVRAVRDEILELDNKFQILDIVILKQKQSTKIVEELQDLANSEARVMFLYCNQQEAKEIFAASAQLGLTTKNYVWIVTQSVVGTKLPYTPTEFPTGMLGIHFNSTHHRLLDQIEKAVYVFGHALDLFVGDPKNRNASLSPNMNCNTPGDPIWSKGGHFFKYLKNVSISSKPKLDKPDLEFNLDGTMKFVELDVVNLNKHGMWEKIGTWTRDGLEIKDIVWPGNSPKPPPGVPEKFNLKVTFMEEPPYVNMAPPDNETGECKSTRAVLCRYAPEDDLIGVNLTEASTNPKYYQCCSGFCIDLLQKFATDLGFTYDLSRVEDGTWGVLSANGSWNGLISELLEHKADIVVTSIKINSERQKAVDFTVPFLETGIAIAVAKRTGIISPKAFLEPFDTTSWLMILLICIQVAAFTIFLFEWVSPVGYDMKLKPPRSHKFSLFRTYWLVWAILFGAAVNVDCPRSYTARFVANVWAMFAVVFLAIYTANLAAFMITREEHHELTGIDDKLLTNPHSYAPPFRFGTIPHGNTWAVLKQNKKEMHDYMKQFNRSTVQEGIKAVKRGELDAFIYDATVLDYLVGQDNECRLLTVGSWYAMTGYGFAMPKKSKYLTLFNHWMIKYKENGDLERLQRFWLQGACKPSKHKRNASNHLGISQFMSAFLLLASGVLFTVFLLVLEHIYFRYFRKHLAKQDKGGCCTLMSLSMGKSLSFRGAVFEATDMIKFHRCKDPVCDNQLWRTKQELDMARRKIRELEKELQRPFYPNVIPETLLRPRDLTRNYVTTNETGRFYVTSPCCPHHHRLPAHRLYRDEITEIETVL